MKLNRLILPSLALLATGIYLSCQKTETPSGPEPGAGHQVELVTAHVSGRIVDNDKLPVSGATVRIGATTVSTDVDGLFSVNNVQVDKTAALVQVEKDGFFKGMKTLVVTPGKDNPVAIELIKKTVTGTFTASGGGTIPLPSGGGSIVFEANSIMNPANNAGYTGAVSVSAFFINPAADNFQDIMPGTLRGIDANNNETGLKSYGMMAVELQGSSGQKLQLAGGKKAVIRFPIPASLQAEAPATIPLWSLNDTTGLWKEEGVATKQGNEYVGSVGHFSYWNCDAPFPVITFTATIKTQQNTGLAGARVVISATGNDSTLSGYAFTNAEGTVTGMIPANRALTLKVYDRCGTVLHSKNIGPFTANTDLGSIAVTASYTTVTFTGTVTNCSNSAVTSGYVTIQLDGGYYRASIDNGAYSLAITRCTDVNADAQVTANDIANNHASAPQTFAVTGTSVNTGQINVCGNLPERYIYYTVNGVSGGFSHPVDTIAIRSSWESTFYRYIIAGRSRTNAKEPSLDLIFNTNQQPGTFDAGVYLRTTDNKLWMPKYPNDLKVIITEFGTTTGQYIKGTFSGSVIDTLNNSVPGQIEGRFQYKHY